MVRVFVYIFLVGLLLGCTGDRADDCITSSGDIGTEIRQLSNFTEVYVEDRVKLILKQDSARAGEVILEGPENLLQQVTTSIDKGRLSIRNDNTCNFVRTFDYELKVHLYINKISRLQVESIAEVTTEDTVFVDLLNIEHNALSDISLTLGGNEVYVRSRNSSTTYLRGRIKKLKGSIEDVSELQAGQLFSDEVLLDTHTPLDCFTRALRGVFVNIYNDGSIIQYGEPSEYRGVGEGFGDGQLLIK